MAGRRAIVEISGELQDLPAGDDLSQHLFKPGLPGGQVVIGGTNALDELELQGNTAGDGLIRIRSPISFEDSPPVAPFAFTFARNATASGFFVGGFLNSIGTVPYDTGVFIWSLLSEGKVFDAAANPGFAALTTLQILPTIRNSGNFDLVRALVVNAGPIHQRTTVGTSSTPGSTGLSFAPRAVTLLSGAVLTYTDGMTAMDVRPSFNTVAGSTVNLGTIRGVQFFQPSIALFGSGAGANNMTAYYGIDFPDMTFGGATPSYSVIRSLLNAGTNKYFLDHTGTAQSRLGGALTVTGDSLFDGFVDINKPVALGGAGFAQLGRTGGAGPAVQAQNQWVQIRVNGLTRWLAVWA